MDKYLHNEEIVTPTDGVLIKLLSVIELLAKRRGDQGFGKVIDELISKHEDPSIISNKTFLSKAKKLLGIKDEK